MRGKRIVVVGMGNSAMDIASELSTPWMAEKLYIVRPAANLECSRSTAVARPTR